MHQLRPANLSDLTDETLWSLGKFIEHDADLQATAPGFCSWLHPLLVAEHQRRQNEPDAAPGILAIPGDWTAADIADALLGSTALSYADNQDAATCRLLDAITFGIAVLAANRLRKLDERTNAYKGN